MQLVRLDMSVEAGIAWLQEQPELGARLEELSAAGSGIVASLFAPTEAVSKLVPPGDWRQ